MTILKRMGEKSIIAMSVLIGKSMKEYLCTSCAFFQKITLTQVLLNENTLHCN